MARCVVCGVGVPTEERGRPRKYCAEHHPKRSCTECGKELRHGAKLATCRDCTPRKPKPDKEVGWTQLCPRCQGVFYGRKRKYCSDGCSRAAYRSANIDAERDRIRSLSAQRRAQKLDPEAENFSRQEIFDRDGWICQLCNNPVDPEAPSQSALSASLDHKIPLAKGGKHTRSNSQLAHLVCNQRKGAQLLPETTR